MRMKDVYRIKDGTEGNTMVRLNHIFRELYVNSNQTNKNNWRMFISSISKAF